MRQHVLAFILGHLVTCSLCVSRDAKLSDLEQRVESLEQQFSNLVPDLIAKFGLVARCILPTVEHGKVKCDWKGAQGDNKPGTTCSAECHSGYVVTPNHHETRCLKTGDWSVELKCEIPLLVVSGGTVDGKQTGDSGVEVISFHNSSGCQFNIPDMPLSKDGEHRTMHNLIYVPKNPSQHPPFLFLLACNGLTQASEASCDSWRMGDGRWNYHSNPNKGTNLDQLLLDMQERSSYGLYGADEAKKKVQMGKSGRYAAASFSTGTKAFIMGGMIHNTTKHLPTNTARKLDQTFWKEPDRWAGPRAMNKDRAFFCIAKLDGVHMAIGGYSGKIEKSMEAVWKTRKNLPEMKVSRSGHGCTGLGSSQILVSGGSRSDGARAMAGSELLMVDRWESVGEMVRMRFGHALVNVGGRIIALGGKERNPDVVLSSGEEFDLGTKSWTSIGKILDKPRANFGYALIPHSLIPGCTIQDNLDPGLIDPK